MNTALVIVDIQQDYFPKGRIEVVGAIEASLAANKLPGSFSRKAFACCSRPAHFYTSRRDFFSDQY
jgi:hypothetical protein